MAKQATKRGKYPWDEWLNGESWRLTRGVDFQVSLQALRAAASQAAKRQGCRVTTRKVNDTTLVLRAVREAPAPAATATPTRKVRKRLRWFGFGRR